MGYSTVISISTITQNSTHSSIFLKLFILSLMAQGKTELADKQNKTLLSAKWYRLKFWDLHHLWIRDLYDNSIVAYKTGTEQTTSFKEANEMIDRSYIHFYDHERIQLKTGVAPLTLRHFAYN